MLLASLLNFVNGIGFVLHISDLFESLTWWHGWVDDLGRYVQPLVNLENLSASLKLLPGALRHFDDVIDVFKNLNFLKKA